MKTTPLTPVLQAEGAVMGVVNGWERVDYMRPTPDFAEPHGFRLGAEQAAVAEEVHAVATSAGLAEISGFNRIEITGRDALPFLDRLVCSRLPGRTGKVGLAYLLNADGMLKAEATITRLPDSSGRPPRIWYGSAAASEFHDMDWLSAHLRPEEDVHLCSLTNTWTTLVLAGPKSRDVLTEVARGDWSAKAFPWLSAREAHVGIAPAVVLAVSYSGELAYEIHVPNAHLLSAYTALREAGMRHGLRLFGGRAIEAMRLEKGFLHWKADILTEFDPFETGLSRFVDLAKPDFIGKAALLARHENGLAKRLVTLSVSATDREAQPGSSAMHDGRVVGTVTSGAWGHRTGLNLALAFVEPGFADTGTALDLDLLGDLCPAEVIPTGPYDPGFAKVKT